MNLFRTLESYNFSYNPSRGFSYKKGFSIGDIFENEEFAAVVVIFIILVIVCTLIGTLVILLFTHQRNSQLLGTQDRYNCAHISVNATIINKAYGAPNTTTPFDSITFEFEGGERKEFYLSDKALFNSLIVGDKGILTYAGKALISFTRQ